MRCRYCDKYISVRVALKKRVIGCPWWHFCDYFCWSQYLALGVMFQALIPPLKRLCGSLEQEMENTLGKIRERVKELEDGATTKEG